MKNYSASVSSKLSISEKQVVAVLDLLEEGATIPFIARYRKDKTGALDEVQIQQIQEEAKFQQDFADRKLFIEKTISEQGKMTGFLQGKINEATTLNELKIFICLINQKEKRGRKQQKKMGLSHWLYCYSIKKI